MKTRRNHTEARNLTKRNDRWRWIAGASAAAAAASQGAVVQINLINNKSDAGGNLLDADLSGNGQNEIVFSGTNKSIVGIGVAVNINAERVIAQTSERTNPFTGGLEPFYNVAIGSQGAFGSRASQADEVGLIPVKFADPKFNGGASTNALLDLTAFSSGFGGATISLTRLVFDDANPTSTLAGVVAGGTNTSIGSTEDGFFARTKNDFNDDGSSDLLWQNVSNGNLAVWFMNGTSILSEQSLGVESNTAWQLVGSGVFNTSGYNDLLWQNTSNGAVAVWFMNGTTYVSSRIIATQPNTNWKIVGAADFNGDGMPDLLWQNTSTGAIAVWFMNGTTYVSSQIIATQPNTAWKIVGTGDFNGDGNTDILWQNTSTGTVAVWFMNGTTVASSAILGTAPNSNWKIVGAGDFNGDGKPDILWQNTSTGAIAVWFMNGTTFVSGQIIATEANTSWQIRNR
jgi:hypothetical protein